MSKQPAAISDITPQPADAKKPSTKFKFPQLRERAHGYRQTRYLVGIFLVIIVVFFAFLLFSSQPVRDPFTKTQQVTMGIPLYYPDTLPHGYHIDYTSVSVPSTGVIVLAINGPRDSHIYMSEETTPGSDVIKSFTGSIYRPATITTPLGSGVAGTFVNNAGQTASVQTNNKTWIIVNSNNTPPISVLESILNHLVVSSS